MPLPLSPTNKPVELKTPQLKVDQYIVDELQIIIFCKVTIPKTTTPGSYVLQYKWDSYVNCVDLNVKAASNAQNGDDPNKSLGDSSTAVKVIKDSLLP
jgi:hypothetical protein